MSSSLSKKRSIALSYGIFVHPTPITYVDPAHELACRIMNHLWQNWGSDDSGLRHGEVDLYNINIPLIEELLAGRSLKIYWTTLWRNSYGRLFENVSGSRKPNDRTIILPGSDATLAEVPESNASKHLETSPLLFNWSPDIEDLMNPTANFPPVGSDGWAIHNGWASVTPLRAAFAESYCAAANTKGSEWKL
jgi:broad specificity polyphosphatase/5'/3'-nucleotidase SurE